jgi:hypothetical protein
MNYRIIDLDKNYNYEFFYPNLMLASNKLSI